MNLETKRGLASLARFADANGIGMRDLIGKSRRRRVAHLRQDAYLAVRDETKLSLQRIGELFGNRHHATVIYGLRQARARRAAQ